MKSITFHSHEASISVQALLAGNVKVIDHAPEGWQAVQRMGRSSYIEWQGAQGWELQIPVLFDGYSSNRSVESVIKRMEKLCEVPTNQSKKIAVRTPIMTVDANGACPHDFTNDPKKRWVIITIDWDDGNSVITNSSNKRMRQMATVTCWEYTPETILSAKEIPPQKNKHKAKVTTWKIKKGDTLQKIATHLWGSAKHWRAIATLNKIRDPNHLQVGKVIKIPQSFKQVA